SCWTRDILRWKRTSRRSPSPSSRFSQRRSASRESNRGWRPGTFGRGKPDSDSQEISMSEPQRYEVLVLGSGAGGKLLAWHLATSGRRTAVVERKWIGGSCPNVNCLPSKNEIWSARVADLVHHAAKFGIEAAPYPGRPTPLEPQLAGAGPVWAR